MAVRKISKLWFGVGTAVILGGGAASSADLSAQLAARAFSPPFAALKAVVAPRAGASSRVWLAAAATAGQGGEGGESGAPEGLDPHVKFFRDMGLVRGHLLVGDELVQAGLWDEALPHFHHPIEEIYPAIGEKLAVQGLRPFDRALKALTQAVAAKNAAAYATSLKVVNRRMEDTETAMKRFAEPWVKSRISTVIAMLQVAAGEYEASIESGKIVKPVEYQDARGFVFYAGAMLESMAKDLAVADLKALAATQAALLELKTAWPTALPPETPVKTAAAVLAGVSRVELAAGPFLKK
jgi:hypothetical protein